MRAQGAFSMVEMMVAMSVLLLVLAGILSSHVFGMRMFQISRSKLGASDEARKAISMLVQEIRTAKLVKLGDGTLTKFTEVGINSPQKGSAIQIYPSTDTNDFVRYFWDSGDKKLKRTTDATNSVAVVANSITNSLVFTAEDFQGNILTNNENNRVIGLTLQFYQIQYPIVLIGPGQYYDYYQLRTKITRRALE